MRRLSRRVTQLAVVALAAPALSACSTHFAPEPPPASTPAPTVSPTNSGPAQITVQNATDLQKRPFIKVKSGSLPSTVQTTDLIPGTGRTATANDTVTVQYVAAVGSTGQEFQASWDNGTPVNFVLPQSIPGFRTGVAGMKEGGRREIIMPPDQAYGAQGYNSLVGPNEHLIFIVDLIKIDS